MKKISRIYRWIIISILCQSIILAYFNFIYLPNRGSIKATMYEVAEDKIEDKKVKLPSDAEDISVSYNGLFLAYSSDSKIVIMDVKKKKKIKTLEPSEGSFDYYRWLPDRDMLIYSLKEPKGKTGRVQILTYDVDAELERSYPEIKDTPEGSEVVDIELSPLTNIVYAKIKTADDRARIYKYNIMDNLSLVTKTDASILIKETSYSDNLVYQLDGERVTVRDGKSGKNTYLSKKGEAVLLEIASEDNIYLGEIDNDGKVTKIRYGKYDEDSSKWKEIGLDVPAKPSDIYVTPSGNIYRADSQEKKIYNTDGKSVSYDGDLLDVLDDYLVCKDNNSLEIIAIQKD